MQPLASVIIPVYNVLPYLREALDSVVRQTYQNLEIIIVDDGSTDGSGMVCDEYKSDSRVRVIHQENRGLAGARNTGLNAANGAYVAFLDADDAWCPEMLQSMISGIKKNNADLSVCGYQSCQTKGKLLPLMSGVSGNCFKDEVISGNEALRRLFLGGINNAVWNKIYRRDLWDNIRFVEGRVYEDVPVMYQLFRKCKTVQLLPKGLIAYRVHAGSITQTVTLEYVRDYLHSMQLRDMQMIESLGLFNEEDTHRFYELQLRGIICHYSQWFSYCKTPESRTAMEELWTVMLHRKEKIQNGNLSIKTWMMYQVCRCSPRLLRWFSSVYHACCRFVGGSR